MTRTRTRTRTSERGFTLIETVFALAIMAGGLLSLAAVFTYGMLHLNTGTSLLTAKEKATEAIESVFMSRDTLVINWDQVRNQAGGGVFLDGPRDVREPGADGLVNTNDDGAIESVVLPGMDGTVGTVDDEVKTLDGFTREIVITDLNANLREIRVTITYPFGQGSREFVLTTYISAFA